MWLSETKVLPRKPLTGAGGPCAVEKEVRGQWTESLGAREALILKKSSRTLSSSSSAAVPQGLKPGISGTRARDFRAKAPKIRAKAQDFRAKELKP